MDTEKGRVTGYLKVIIGKAKETDRQRERERKKNI